MSKKDMTLVYYYIPEDKDDPDCPNVFGVAQSKANIRLSHIHQSFPLKGSYLYRFKHNHEGTAVWLDLPDKESKLPTYKDRIIIKATRVQWNDSKLHSQYKEKQAAHSQPVKRVEDINVFEESNHSQPVKQLQTKQQQQNFNHHNLFDPKPVLIQPAHKPDNNEFNLFEHGSHNGANIVVNHGGNQKSQPMHFLQEFKHGDLI